MKIGFISDTHEQVRYIKNAVKLFNKEKCAQVFHLGDICSPIMAQYFSDLFMPMKMIFGNNDGDRDFLRMRFSFAEIYKGPRTFSEGGKRIICMHEPILIKELSASQSYDMIAYGHTHRKRLEKHGDTVILNPGECSALLTGVSTVAIWDTNEELPEILDITQEIK